MDPKLIVVRGLAAPVRSAMADWLSIEPLSADNSTILRGVQINDVPPPPYEQFAAERNLFHNNNVERPRCQWVKELCRLGTDEYRVPERLAFHDLKDIEEWLTVVKPVTNDYIYVREFREASLAGSRAHPPMAKVVKCQGVQYNDKGLPVVWFLTIRAFTHYIFRVAETPGRLRQDDASDGCGRPPLGSNEPRVDRVAFDSAVQVAAHFDNHR